jgi:hypothetical protein
MILVDLCKEALGLHILSTKSITLNDDSITTIKSSMSPGFTLVYHGELDKAKDYPEGALVVDNQGRLFLKMRDGFTEISTVTDHLSQSVT